MYGSTITTMRAFIADILHLYYFTNWYQAKRHSNKHPSLILALQNACADTQPRNKPLQNARHANGEFRFTISGETKSVATLMHDLDDLLKKEVIHYAFQRMVQLLDKGIYTKR